MKRFRSAAALIISLVCFVGSANAAERPNIVLVITDDQGYGDLSCHGNPVLKTPNLDKLQSESVRLLDYHVAPTCAPTRAALLTGHWTNRTGVWHTIMGRSLIRENEVLIGKILADAGYATGMFGKWHLGDNFPYRPEDRGFQEVMRHGGGGVGQTPDYWDNSYFDGSYFHNGKPEPVKGFCTDVFFDYAKRFIDANKDGKKPFFAYIATNAPHGPMHCPPKFSAPYKKALKSKNEKVANFLGMIANIDDNVGKLRAYLKENDLEKNTIFIFTTDNGTSSGRAVFDGGMRGAKGSEYEGGHRVPFFVHWPKGKLTGGRDVAPITGHVDVVPTLLDFAGVETPKGIEFDGTSIRALLEGKSDGWPDRVLVTDSQRVKDPIKWRKSSVMTSQWRLINGAELYEIKKDPKQEKDVSAAHPEAVKRLRDFYDAWWADISPSFKQDCAIYLGSPGGNPATLTCHDWITSGSTPWNQRAVRGGQAGPSVTGYWAVRVDKAGEYEIELRRWPKESDAAIDAGLPAGADVPGEKAYRAVPGKAMKAAKATIKIGSVSEEKAVRPGDKSVTFRVKLEEGNTRLSARFLDSAGKEFGAYYAYVKKL